MKYKYKLKQSSYYTSNGCDCCEDDYVRGVPVGVLLEGGQ